MGRNRSGGEKQNTFNARMGHKNSVKRIIVNGRERFNLNGVPPVGEKAPLDPVSFAILHTDAADLSLMDPHARRHPIPSESAGPAILLKVAQ